MNKTPKLVLLTESELDKAESALAAKGIMAKLERMAADVTRIEGNDIMPLLGAMRQSFGQDHADRFNDNVVAAIRSTSEALTKASMVIANEVNRMEGILNGENPTDMDMGDDIDAGGFEEPEAELGDGAGQEDDLASALGDGDADGAQMGEDDIDDAFGDLESEAPAAGRVRKESVERRNIRALRESANPNRLIYESFVKAMGMTSNDVERSVMSIAETFAIDPTDVIAVVREGKTWKDEKGKGDKRDFKYERRSKKKDKEEHLDEDAVEEGKTWKDEKGKSSKNKDFKSERRTKKKGQDENLEEGVAQKKAKVDVLDESILNRLKPRKRVEDMRVVRLDLNTEEEALKRAQADFKQHLQSTMEVPYLISVEDGEAKQYNAPLNDPFVVRVVDAQRSELGIWDGDTLTPKWRVDVVDGRGRIPPNVKKAWTDGPTYRVQRRKPR